MTRFAIRTPLMHMYQNVNGMRLSYLVERQLVGTFDMAVYDFFSFHYVWFLKQILMYEC